MKAGAAFLALGLFAAPAVAATAPELSPRPPLERGSAGNYETEVAPEIALPSLAAPVLRPLERPASPQVLAALARPSGTLSIAPEMTPRPSMRSPEFTQNILFGRAKKRRGSVCGDIEIQGTEVGNFPDQTKGCGITDAVRVTSVAGVTLSQSALMTCGTAKALRKWVEKDVEKAFGRGNRVVSLRVAAHYACRPRNNQAGAKISEHGRGRAIDISAFTLADGTTVTVLNGWPDRRRTGKTLRRIWKAACGPFRTVLGPEADRYHRDHFHLDTANHRSGRYCR